MTKQQRCMAEFEMMTPEQKRAAIEIALRRLLLILAQKRSAVVLGQLGQLAQ